MIEPDILEQLRVYNESRDRMGDEADTLCVDAAEEITSLRAQVIRRDEEISDLRHEIESARDAAKGENALRLEAERERDTLRAEVERWVKEVAHLKLSAEKADRERDDQVYMLGRILQFLS
jgi:regulator of replication initiation timing